MSGKTTTRCSPCHGTGIYPPDIELVNDGTIRRKNARNCGACSGFGWWFATEHP